MLLIFIDGQITGVCIEDERKALLEIKASLYGLSNRFDVNNLLTTWVDHEITGGECCDWERIKCDTTTGHIIGLSFNNMFLLEYERDSYIDMRWPLNFSPFLHFKELRSLDLSNNFIDNTIVSTGLERLSSLNKLEVLNLSSNYIETNIFPLFHGLPSLKILDLSYFNGYQVSPTYDISEFSTLKNLEVLDLTYCGYHGTLQIHELSNLTNLKKLALSFNYLNITPSIADCKRLMKLEKLESVSIGANNFNKRIIACLSFLPSLKILDMRGSKKLGSSIHMQELSLLKELKALDLGECDLRSLTINGTMSNLLHLDLDFNNFNDDIMRSMATFPSLRFLSLQSSIGGRLFANEVPNLPHLEVLLLSLNGFSGILPVEALASFRYLEVLDLSRNDFVGSIPSTIKSLSALKVISFAYNKLQGSLPDHGFCELKNLHELDLCGNMLNGNLPDCFYAMSSLKLFDISSNRFTGTLPPSLIANLTSLQYVDFSYNKFEGPFSFSSFSNHTQLEVVKFISDNDNFEIETEDPVGWIPMFELKVLMLSNCNVNRPKGSGLPSFLVTQHRLHVLDLSHNSMRGKFPNWLIKNNPMLGKVNLRNNLLCGTIMLFNTNHNIRFLDISGNLIKGIIPKFIQKFLPGITYLNLSSNSLDGVIPSSIGNLSELIILDLSHNKLSGEMPIGSLANNFQLDTLKVSNNNLHGRVLSGNLNLGLIRNLHLDNNFFTGKIGNVTTTSSLDILDISNNYFTGLIPDWIRNMSFISQLVLRNNNFEGSFPCGTSSFFYLDISKNSFSGSIHESCLNMESLVHLHLGSNRLSGSIPKSFRNLTSVLTLDIGNNYFSGEIPEFIGELSNLRFLLLGKNNLNGSIPNQICQLTNVSLLDLSSNSFSGTIPGCLRIVTNPSSQALMPMDLEFGPGPSFYGYSGVLSKDVNNDYELFGLRDQVQFTTKTLSLTYTGVVLDIMSGLDLSCNKLTGDIPEELGLLTEIRVLNLSHNLLTGSIPLKLSNLTNIESLDISSNSLTGKVPPELTKLISLSFFNVSFNNLSGKLPEMNAQFSTFTKDSYEGNPLLCGPPLEKRCNTESQVTDISYKETPDENWFHIDMTSFYGSCGSTWFVFMLGFVAILYINPYWRRRWLDVVEECIYTCYYSLCELVRKFTMIILKLDLY